MSRAGEWLVSRDDEHWPFDCSCETHEAAIAMGKGLYGGESFFVGRVDEQVATPAVDVDEILDRARESIHDMGIPWDIAHEQFDCSNEQRLELEKAMGAAWEAWVERHELQPNCFTVGTIERIAP